MRFDDVLETIGGFGLYQKYVFALSCGPILLAGFYSLNPVFLLGQPEHRCAIPGYPNDTYHIQGDFHQCLVNLVIPTTLNSDHDSYDRCNLHVVEDPVSICKQGIDSNVTYSNSTLRCTSWVYDRTVFTETFVSELDLVCERKIWVANAEMLLFAGMLVGSLASGILADVYGRKPVLYISIVAMAGSSIGLAFVHNYYAFVISQFVLGAASIATFMTAFIISIEITSTKKRVWPGIISQYPYVVALLVYAGIAYGLRDWSKIQLVSGLPAIGLLSYWWLMPESPRWLLTKGQIKEAEEVIKKAAKWNKAPLPKGFSIDPTECDENKGIALLFRLCTSKTLCFRTSLIFFNWTVVSFAYVGLSLNIGNLAGDVYLNFVLSGLVEIPAYLIVMCLVDRTGRRSMYSVTMLIGGISCVSTLLAIKYGEETGVLSVTLAMIGKMMVSSGYAVQYIYTAEVFPTVVRNAGLGGASLFARVGSMGAPYIVTLGEEIGGSIGEAFPLIVFGVMSFLSGLVSLLLPETLNKHIPDTIADGERFGRSEVIPFAVDLKQHAEEEEADKEKIPMVHETSS